VALLIANEKIKCGNAGCKGVAEEKGVWGGGKNEISGLVGELTSREKNEEGEKIC